MVKKIDPKVLEEIAELEVLALLEGLQDPELRRNPSFLEKVRKFMAQNRLITSEQTPGIRQLQRETEDIPEFDDFN
ncbi:hypothetical protein [Anaeroselena agilis]|uniref:Uncharacterized protein n=1 Tax=Anaeroselena agilis TaxID=3063788 RepID=A0ABU3NV22_9FIRM|nr:hypothetical protein [Selenomonadales bacterium 4137-cl]